MGSSTVYVYAMCQLEKKIIKPGVVFLCGICGLHFRSEIGDWRGACWVSLKPMMPSLLRQDPPLIFLEIFWICGHKNLILRALTDWSLAKFSPTPHTGPNLMHEMETLILKEKFQYNPRLKKSRCTMYKQTVKLEDKSGSYVVVS